MMVDFPCSSVFEKLAIGDKMRIYANRVGLRLKNIR